MARNGTSCRPLDAGAARRRGGVSGRILARRDADRCAHPGRRLAGGEIDTDEYERLRRGAPRVLRTFGRGSEGPRQAGRRRNRDEFHDGALGGPDVRTKIALAVAVVAAAIAAVVVFLPHGGEPGTATTSPTTSANTLPGVYVVKIDNAAAARPQTGLGSADVVYVEPVEGGLTRFAAVYSSPPEVVGPVRSARETDLDLLAQYGRPVLAYSGSAPELVPMLERSGLVRATPEDVADAYSRDNARVAPHNLYVRPQRLPGPADGPAKTPQTGPAPPGGRPVTSQDVTYLGDRFGLAWNGGWAISLDGSPLKSTESGQVTATTVVLQQVSTRSGEYVEDASGQPSPVVVTVGSGSGVVLRDGLAFDVTWSRPTATEPTRYTAADGTEVPLAPGRTWVFLVVP